MKLSKNKLHKLKHQKNSSRKKVVFRKKAKASHENSKKKNKKVTNLRKKTLKRYKGGDVSVVDTNENTRTSEEMSNPKYNTGIESMSETVASDKSSQETPSSVPQSDGVNTTSGEATNTTIDNPINLMGLAHPEVVDPNPVPDEQIINGQEATNVDDNIPEAPVDDNIPEAPVDDNIPEAAVDESLPEAAVDESLPEAAVDESLPEADVDSVPEATVDSVPEAMADENVPEAAVDSVPEAIADESVPEANSDKTNNVIVQINKDIQLNNNIKQIDLSIFVPNDSRVIIRDYAKNTVTETLSDLMNYQPGQVNEDQDQEPSADQDQEPSADQ